MNTQKPKAMTLEQILQTMPILPTGKTSTERQELQAWGDETLEHPERWGNPVHLSTRKGRPKNGEEPVGTVTRTVRMPLDLWTYLEGKAHENGLSLHAAIRTALVEWATRH